MVNCRSGNSLATHFRHTRFSILHWPVCWNREGHILLVCNVNCSINTLPGTKLKLVGKLSVCNGHLLLFRANCKLLGGHVQNLVDTWNLKRVNSPLGITLGSSFSCKPFVHINLHLIFVGLRRNIQKLWWNFVLPCVVVGVTQSRVWSVCSRGSWSSTVHTIRTARQGWIT